MNTQKQPLISVIMPAHNAGKFVMQAIDSIINQTYTNWEMVIINDASNDNTYQILKKYSQNKKIKILKNKYNLGVAGSLNKALKMTKGEYIARMDGDDISLPKRLETQVKLLQNNPKLVAIGTQVNIIDEETRITAKKEFPINPKVCADMLMLTVPIQHPSLMVRAGKIKKYGYNSHYKTAEDWDLYFKLLNDGQLSNTKETLFLYRQVFGTNGFHKIKRAFWLIFKIRLNGILKYNYRPTFIGILGTILQTIIVAILPQKLTFKLFNFWRVKNFSNGRKLNLKLHPAIVNN